MLCSHQKKFIYLKTRKTAGTSVEIFLEKFCCPPESYIELLNRLESITEDGIIGFRTDRTETLLPNGAFWHHMPAAEVKQLLGKDVWDTYYKFWNVRNPFDKVVSFFWMKLSDVERDHLSSAPFEDVRRRFLTFLSDPLRLPLDQHVFMIDKKPIVDDFIRYEYILTDLKRVC